VKKDLSGNTSQVRHLREQAIPEKNHIRMETGWMEVIHVSFEWLRHPLCWCLLCRECGSGLGSVTRAAAAAAVTHTTKIQSMLMMAG